MGTFAQWVLGLLLIVCGLGYALIRTAADMAGDPDQGFLNGWGPVLSGVAVAVLGVLVIVF